MEKINQLKIKLKKWEVSFVSENNRKPNKDDISLAPDDIKETYKQYNVLKRNTTRQPAHDVNGDSEQSTTEIDPWASTLNKKAICVQEHVKKSAEDNSFMQSIGQKLLAQALSTNTLKSAKPKRLSNGSISSTTNQTDNDLCNLSGTSIFSKAALLTKSTSFCNVNESVKPAVHVKRSHFAGSKPLAAREVTNQQTSVLLDDSIDSNVSHFTESPSDKLSSQNFTDSKSTADKNLLATDNKAEGGVSRNSFEQTDKSNDSISTANETSCSVERNAVSGKTKGLKRHASDDREELSTECWKRRRHDENGFADDGNTTQEADDDAQDFEHAVAASSNVKKPVKRKLVAPPSDNFVRLNMKVKKYRCKGISGRTGGSYKRAAWKQKMKSRSESMGNKCFKCGEAGHWANKCKGKGKRRASKQLDDWPENADVQTKVNDADFPSINEAMRQARGIKCGQDTSSHPQEQGTVHWELDVVRTAYLPPVAPPAAEPMYQLQEDGSVPSTPLEVRQVLKRFGFSSFRKGQEEVVMRVLCGLSTLVVLSTGAGKSLCYQMPAFIYAQRSKCITLVISPLVSLMDDQVTGLPPGVKGACLHANLSKVQRERVVTAVAAGDVHFLLVSPETAVGGGGGSGGLPPPDRMPTIAFACIDEAHCVSEWSHHFRPSYLRICKVLKEKYGVKCILGLTATATMATAASIASHIDISDYDSAVIRGRPMPENLQLSASRDEHKEEALMQLLQGHRFSACQSIIIYCTRRQQTTRIATLIRTCLKKEQTSLPTQAKKGSKKAAVLQPGEWNAECYHAGMTASQRRRIQNAFMSGRLRVVVATVAFGMGLDKSDVRGIVHYDMPRRFESYVQEIGRAGRDGKTSFCHLFLQPEGQDMHELKRHIYANTVDRSVVKKLVRKVFPRCRCAEAAHHRGNLTKAANQSGNTSETDAPSSGKRLCSGHERALPIDKLVQSLDIKEEGIATLLCYLELHQKRWLQNLLAVYATCTIQCYGGPSQLQEIARKCPPVAVAIAIEKRDGISHESCSRLQFDVVQLSDRMGWDSGPVKRELKLLQWSTANSGEEAGSKSGVIVEFSDLAFHIRSPGDLSDDEMDEVIDYLTNFLNNQERVELFQLRHLYKTLYRISHGNVWMCTDEVDVERSDKLKAQIYTYFEQQSLPTTEQCDKDDDDDTDSIVPKQICGDLSVVRGDIIAFIQTYSHEHVLTGRAIARVFHGIDSPRFPAEVWGRQRRFWRAHLPVDFNIVRKLAERELVNFK